jgi:putative phosphoesterase
VIAVISDTHLPRGTRRLPPTCLRRLAAAELILHAGDFTRLETLRELEELAPVIAVHGNVDDAELHGLLPETRLVQLDGGAALAMLHDAGPARGRLTRLRQRFPRADAVIFGHSHIPLLERDACGFQIFNPGSPTERRRQAHHTMGVLRPQGTALGFRLLELD